jgi:hypothetical protein
MALLGDEAAQRAGNPEWDPAAWIPPVSSYLVSRAIQWVGVTWFLILGLAAITGIIEERHEASRTFGPDAAIRTLWSQPGSHAHLARLRSGTIHRSHRHPLAVPKIVSSYDSNDDEATEDYDDDDAWDEPNDFDDGHSPIIACLRHLALFLIGPDFQSVSSCTAAPSPRFLALQRLRC